MGKDISLFVNYSQNENRVTNYCGLILKLLYQDNPVLLEEVMSQVVSNDIKVVPKFEQQKKVGKSVPDLVIRQEAFNVFVETKNFDWFYSDQIKRHIDGLASANCGKSFLVLLTSEFKTSDPVSNFESEIKYAKDRNIIMGFLTFEVFYQTLKDVSQMASTQFKNMLIEFEQYLSEAGYLPGWKKMLDIVNCSGASSRIEAEHGNVYFCPNRAGAYSHRRAKYFGAYWNKNINFVFDIKAIVVLSDAGKIATIKWKNVEVDDAKLEQEALDKLALAEQCRKDYVESEDYQIFLLDNMRKLDYSKSSTGGMMGSKQYHYFNSEMISVDDVVAKLNGKTWE